jgi:1-acyl-sn-glycerol-3-phosphate acyltransferase
MITPSIASQLIALLARCLLGAHARWYCQPEQAVQRVYFANHTSHLDTLVLWSLIPPPARYLTRPVAAREYWNADRLRRFVAHEIFNAVLIQRPDRTDGATDARSELASRAFAAMLAALDSGHSLIIFPEGTRGDGVTMRPFKSGLYHLARTKPGLELIPVYLENLNRILPKGELLPVPLLGSVTFGPPLYLAERETKNAFLERAARAIEELHS